MAENGENHPNRRRNQGRNRGHRHGRGRGRGVPVEGVENWGEGLTIQVPAGIADVLRGLMAPHQGHHQRRQNRNCQRRGHQMRRRQARVQRRKEEENKMTEDQVEEEIQDLNEEPPSQIQPVDEREDEVSAIEKRLKAALENNENIPKWLTAMIPPLNIQETEEAKPKTKPVIKEHKKAEIKLEEVEEDNRFGKDEDIPVWLKHKQAAKKKKAAMREARLKNFNKNCQKQKVVKVNETGSKSVTKGKNGKIVRISNQKTIKKNIGPYELEMTFTEKEILTPKKKDRVENEAKATVKKPVKLEPVAEEEVEAQEEESTDQNITQLLSGLEEEEKVQLFNILKKLIGKK